MKCRIAFARLALLTVLNVAACIPAPQNNNISGDAPPDTNKLADSMRIQPNTPLRNDNLTAWALAKLNYEPPDRFAKPFDDMPLLGRSFILDFAEGGTGPLYVRYDPEKEEANVGVETTIAVGASTESGHELNFIPIHVEDHQLPSETGATAFGVTKEIEPHRLIEVGVGAYGLRMGLVHAAPEIGFAALSETTQKLSPDEARAEDGTRHLQLTGVVGKFDDGHPIVCSTYKKQASLSDPEEKTEDSCVINVHLHSVTIKGSNGRVIAEWPRAKNSS